MDSSGRIHLMDTAATLLDGKPNPEHFVTRDPMPGACNARKVLAALDKLADRRDPIPRSDAALLPLTPFEQGYVLGVLAEYRTWIANR